MAIAKEGKYWVERDGKGKILRRSRARIEEKPKKKKTKVEKEEGGEQ